MTNTPTGTPTNTPTPQLVVSGVVTYGTAVGGPRFVSDVILTGAGSPDVFTATGFDGAYTLTGFGAGSGTQLTLADSGTTSSRLTAELSAQALTAQGFTVTRATLPSATAADGALTAGTIDVYATETATLLERVLARPKLRDDVQLNAALTAQLAVRAQVPLAIDPADDAPQVACRPSTVKAHKLTGLLKLGRAAGNLTYAATAAHVVRGDGLAALHVRFRRVIVASGTKRFDLIARGKAHCVLSSGARPLFGTAFRHFQAAGSRLRPCRRSAGA